MHPLDSILDRWRQEEAGALFSRTHPMGIAFEDLCAAFLTHDPIQSLELQDAKTFADWARERDLNQTDTGIDLIAELRNEPGFAAIQCKFRQTGKTVPKPEIDSFLAASGRSEFQRLDGDVDRSRRRRRSRRPRTAIAGCSCLVLGFEGSG